MPLPISGRTALVGVLGDPVRHSLSPAMHNAALAELGLEWAYLALPTPAADLATVVRALEAMGCRGLSVTIPHKQAVAELCRERSALAQRVGAVNTLVPLDGGGWMGTNTDVEGFMAPLRHGPWQGKRALVLGCGGSARAVVAGLVELGFGAITVAARRPEALAAFAQTCGPWAPQLIPLAWGDLDSATDNALAQADLVVNTTPIGMAGAKDPAGATDPAALKACPLNSAQLDQLRPGATVYDLIYTPRPTQLLRQAAQRGCPTQDGLEMLVQQGAAALRLWSGLETVPTHAMRTAVEAALA
jgi:shikimate dehydrogenase|uniref:shikimate dehydrogenase n=1 Tax=Cyanobium sp. TaxID=2164130 RepID=UPI004047DB1F